MPSSASIRRAVVDPLSGLLWVLRVGGIISQEVEFELASRNCCDSIRHKREAGAFHFDKSHEQSLKSEMS